MSQIYYSNGGGDEQLTPRYGVEILIPHIQHWLGSTVWCPFDKEESSFVEVLRENGFSVISSHIDAGYDFFSYTPPRWDIMISNPPYTNKRKFWERALGLGKPFALLLPVNILSDSIINTTVADRSGDIQLLIPNRRMRFYNSITGETGNQPTFKAVYFGIGIFKRQIILVDMPITPKV